MSMQYILLSTEPVKIKFSKMQGVDIVALPMRKRQMVNPDLASMAYKSESTDPKKTTPSA